MSFNEELRALDDEALVAAFDSVISQDKTVESERRVRLMMELRYENFPALEKLFRHVLSIVTPGLPADTEERVREGINRCLLAVSEYALGETMQNKFPDTPIPPTDSQ